MKKVPRIGFLSSVSPYTISARVVKESLFTQSFSAVENSKYQDLTTRFTLAEAQPRSQIRPNQAEVDIRPHIGIVSGPNRECEADSGFRRRLSALKLRVTGDY